MNSSPDIAFPNLGIRFDHVNQTAINLFGLEVRWYGVLIALGVVAGLLLAIRQAKKQGDNPDQILDFVFFATIAAIIGARLYFVAFSWESFKDNPLSIFNIREGGIAIYGSIIGAVTCAVIFTKVKKINFWHFVDTCIPGLVVGQIIGRFGNFINREAFGGYTNNLFAMALRTSDVHSAYVSDAMSANMYSYGDELYYLVHPTFLYEALWNVAVLALLLFWANRKKFEGELFAMYFVLYGLGRFWIEGLRTDQLKIPFTSLAVSQLLSVVLVIAGTIFIIYNWKKPVAVAAAPVNSSEVGEGAVIEVASDGVTDAAPYVSSYRMPKSSSNGMTGASSEVMPDAMSRGVPDAASDIISDRASGEIMFQGSVDNANEFSDISENSDKNAALPSENSNEGEKIIEENPRSIYSAAVITNGLGRRQSKMKKKPKS